MKIVLHEPGIALNTGNIGRTCAATDTELHLIRPYGFVISQKEIKRAGMDYWKVLDVVEYDSWADFLERNVHELAAPFGDGRARLWMATTKALRTHSDVAYKDGDYIMFGKESAGIPEEILMEDEPHCVRIPMGEGQRSLNLANSAAVILYEALRQNDYAGLETAGQLHEHKW